MSEHVHRWRIDEPRGEPTVQGKCRCGAVRDFRAGEDWGGWSQWRGETPEAPPLFERFRRDSHNLVL